MSDIKKYAVWTQQKLYDKVTSLVAWMKNTSNRRHMYNTDALHLLFKVWDSLSDEQKLKFMEGE